MFSFVYNWLFPNANKNKISNCNDNGIDDDVIDEIKLERARRLPFVWKCNIHRIKMLTTETNEIMHANKEKLSKIHCDSIKLTGNANEYANLAKALSAKVGNK